MRILIAPDKFKEALTAPEAARAIEEGIKLALPDAICTILPLADGGEGTAAILTRLSGGILRTEKVHDPLLNPIRGHWGFDEIEKRAFVELAEASGLRLIPGQLRNPLHTSTYGTGELIRAAISAGAKEIVVGLGGSATNDGGCGLAAALGYRFLDLHGKEIQKPRGEDLIRIRRIDAGNINPDLREQKIKIKAACDVHNALLGPGGATYTFARQKGATEEMLPLLEEGMQHLAHIIRNDLGLMVENIAGSGAAGGAGAGVVAFLNGKLCSGADLILEYSGFHQFIKDTDLVITGEGKLDDTSLQGKLVGRIADIAISQQVPVIVFCGINEIAQGSDSSSLFKDIIQITPDGINMETALKMASDFLTASSLQYFGSMPKK